MLTQKIILDALKDPVANAINNSFPNEVCVFDEITSSSYPFLSRIDLKHSNQDINALLVYSIMTPTLKQFGIAFADIVFDVDFIDCKSATDLSYHKEDFEGVKQDFLWQGATFKYWCGGGGGDDYLVFFDENHNPIDIDSPLFDDLKLTFDKTKYDKWETQILDSLVLPVIDSLDAEETKFWATTIYSLIWKSIYKQRKIKKEKYELSNLTSAA